MTNRILKLSIFVIAITSLTSSSLADCGCTADVNGDATVSGTDLAIVIGSWGPASSGMPGADINADGTVDAQDLGLLLAAWGNCPGPESILTNPDAIRVLAKSAYVWGLPLEFSYRFGNYNALMTAEVNSLAYPPAPAAWNNASTNAGNASVLYINAILDLTGDTALVYTLPNPSSTYNVSQFLDAFINTFANPGSRTTPNATNPTSYLLVGPDSPYAHSRTVTIDGYTFPVIASDTNRAEMLARVLAQTLVRPEEVGSTFNVLNDVAHGIYLNTLEEFLANGGVAFIKDGDYSMKNPTDAERAEAEQWRNAPTTALEFFEQVGDSLKLNDIPAYTSGLGGTLTHFLPKWVVPQSGAGALYFPPSAGQQGALALFAPLGLSESGFRLPCNWGTAQTNALQAGFEDGVSFLNGQLGAQAPAATNYWTYKNANWGTWPNTVNGYIGRGVAVVAGGFASMPADGTYAAQITDANGAALDGGDVHSLTIGTSKDSILPADGTAPPLMVNPATQLPIGFWSLTLYQPGQGASACPCLSQASVLNTYYSRAETEVISVDAVSGYITAKVPYGVTLLASSPVLFGGSTAAAEYGLLPDRAYFIVATPEVVDSVKGTVRFQISATWLQDLSTDPTNSGGDPGTPIQYTGSAGPLVTLTSGTSQLLYGSVQPVSQLGSSEVANGQLQQNQDANGEPDGTYTIWLAPSLPLGVPASNWIPTPSHDALALLYPGEVVNSEIWPIFRIYASAAGEDKPSILPCLQCPLSETVGGANPKEDSDELKATYRFPLITNHGPPPSRP